MAAAPTRSREGGAGGSDDGSTSLLTDDEKRCCWNVDVEKAGRLLDLVKKSSDAVLECRCFKEELLRLSGLFSATDEYLLLKEILDRFLTFDKKHFCDASEAVLQEEAGKFHAVVAGSYPAKLANAVKRSTDVDVFVVVTERTLDNLNELWSLLPGRADDDFSNEASYRYYNGVDNILSVNDFGAVQIIVKYHDVGCLCDHHLNTDFFKSFHHCTRWKIDVFDRLALNAIRYMPLERRSDGDGERNIICEETSLTLRYSKKIVRERGIFRCKVVPARYPNKHATNVSDSGPPTLAHQALYVLLRRNVLDVDDC